MFLYKFMNEQIKKLYGNMKSEPEFMRSINSEIERNVRNMLQSEKENMTEEEYEKYKELSYGMIALGEEGGFIEGFKYAMKLLSECFEA